MDEEAAAVDVLVQSEVSPERAANKLKFELDLEVRL